MNNFIVGISTGNKDVKMSAGEIECSVLNFDFMFFKEPIKPTYEARKC